MKLFNVKSNELIKAKITRINTVKGIKGELNKNFTFDWKLEEVNELYKLEIILEEEVLGLMSLLVIPNEYRVHINLLESSIQNRGKNKQVKNIAHCLIAYACKQSFALGYDGFVSLYPKTELIRYYVNEYNFEKFGRYLALYGSASYNLIKEYLDE